MMLSNVILYYMVLFDASDKTIYYALDLILILGVLKPLVSSAFRLFPSGQFLLVKEAGVPRENNQPSIEN